MLTSLLAAGPRFLQLCRSQYWSEEHLAAYRRSRLKEIFAAAAAIPFYAKHFGGHPGPDDLRYLPVVERADLVRLNQSVRELYAARTEFIGAESSGTTGHNIEVLFDDAHQRGRFAARGRYLVANGWRPWHRSAWLIGLTAGPNPDFRLTQSRFLVGARFLSHIEEFSAQAEWLLKFDPHFIYTLPSNLEAVCSILEDREQRLTSLRKVFTGGEVLEDSIRERTRRVLGVEIADNYGSTELFPAWQCSFGAYHVNAEHALVEIVDERGQPVASGHMGRVLVTTLENRLMPLVRYDMGDYALSLDGRCRCGRTLPLIGRIVGRGINLFRDANGKLISPWKVLDAVKELPGLRQLQVVQRKVDDYIVRIVSEVPVAPEVEALARTHFIRVVGPASITFERVSDIARTKSGKFMSTLCELDAATRPRQDSADERR